jgi:integrase
MASDRKREGPGEEREERRRAPWGPASPVRRLGDPLHVRRRPSPQEKVGPIKQDAIRAYHARRARAHDEPGWCPRVERAGTRVRAEAEAGRVARRQTFATYAEDYKAWALVNERSGRKERYLVDKLVGYLGTRNLEDITTADVERVRDTLHAGRTGASVNRYRDLLSAMFKRAKRLGLVPANPVTGIPKFREAGQRLVFLHLEDEPVLRGVLPARLQPAATIAMHMFPLSHRQALELLTRAVARAQGVIRDAGGDASRLDGFTWHSRRHTFASRLVMAGVDVRTIQELGGWKTLAMVQRYAHLAPQHLRAAVDRLVKVSRKWPEHGETVSAPSGREALSTRRD